ncbi:MAG TPA: 6-bladed beta-propeller [Gemmatimonadaceae bacterium]|nr:6-bladed beta-propeller [Gemmatimonadaceae bacterium]
MRLARCLPLLVCLAACARGDTATTAAWRGTVDTLPGGAVLVRNPAQGVWDSASAWRIVEELRIGSEDAEGPEMFGSIADLDVDTLGRVYVLEGQTQELRVFDSTGAHVRTIGRKGAGPGEFRNATAVRLRGDGTFWVVDPGNARFSLFDTSGTYLRAARRESGFYMIPWGGFVDSIGDIAEQTRAYPREGESRSVMVRYDSLGVARDTIELPEHEGQYFTITNEKGLRIVTTDIPFSPVGILHLDRRGYVWFGVSDRYRIVQRDLAGDTVRIIEREATPRGVSASEIDDEVKRLEWFTRQGGTLDRGRIPSVHPLFGQVFVDDDGHLWVRPDAPRAEQGFSFDVYDPEGRYLGRATSAVQIGWRKPVVRGNRLYAVLADSLGVESVVRCRVVRGAGR